MSKDGGDYKMPYYYKEVYFDQFCEKCKYVSLDENEAPCDECLKYPVNAYSHKPVNFEENPQYIGGEKENDSSEARGRQK